MRPYRKRIVSLAVVLVAVGLLGWSASGWAGVPSVPFPLTGTWTGKFVGACTLTVTGEPVIDANTDEQFLMEITQFTNGDLNIGLSGGSEVVGVAVLMDGAAIGSGPARMVAAYCENQGFPLEALMLSAAFLPRRGGGYLTGSMQLGVASNSTEAAVLSACNFRFRPISLDDPDVPYCNTVP